LKRSRPSAGGRTVKGGERNQTCIETCIGNSDVFCCKEARVSEGHRELEKARMAVLALPRIERENHVVAASPFKKLQFPNVI
jgi:hypothetical protein